MEHSGHQGARPGLAAISALLAVLSISPALAQSSMKSRRDVQAGNHPVGAIAVDYDGDGLLDVVSVDQFDDALSLVKGFGDGTFRRIKTLTVGSLPSGVAFADTNGDGRPDLITVNMRSQEITVNLNDGLGDFEAKISTQMPGFTAGGLAVGDWNGDGRIDVATVAPALNSLAVYTGDGTGHFVPATGYTVGANPKQVVAGDFNRDGKADLAVVNSNSPSIQIWRGDGAAHFTLNATLTTGLYPQGLAAADLDGDTDLDLVVCNYNSDTVGVYLNNGAGGYGSPSTLSPGFGPRAAVVADINMDGKLDLLVTLSKVSGVGQVATLIGNGFGGFGAPSMINTGPVPNTATIGDFNHDESPDLVTVNLTGNTLSILQNTGAGGFIVGNKVPLANGAFPQAVVAADFNKDGKPDVAAANEGKDNVSVAYGDGLGGFANPGSPIATGTTPYSMVVEDYNRDTVLDLVTANNGNSSLTYLQGTGTSFNNFTVSLGCLGPVGLATGDISGDLIPDLAIVCEDSNQVCTRRGAGGSGNQAFGTQVCTTLGGVPSEVTLGNFDGDAYADAAISYSALGTMEVANSNGAGGFGAPSSFPVELQPAGLARGDLDGDGILDIVVANSGSGSISAILGGAPGLPAINSPAGLAPTAIVLADFNLDGILDAATANTNDNNVSLLLGDGTGHFLSAGYYGTRDLPVAIAAGDFNRDGKPDLGVADNFSDSITILLNQSLTGDPLQWTAMLGAEQSVFRWGLVPGAVYDVIRGNPWHILTVGDHADLGNVVCLANDTTDTDTALTPDETEPALGTAFFYVVRAVVDGVPGNYTVSTYGKVGIPSSGGCN